MPDQRRYFSSLSLFQRWSSYTRKRQNLRTKPRTYTNSSLIILMHSFDHLHNFTRGKKSLHDKFSLATSHLFSIYIQRWKKNCRALSEQRKTLKDKNLTCTKRKYFKKWRSHSIRNHNKHFMEISKSQADHIILQRSLMKWKRLVRNKSPNIKFSFTKNFFIYNSFKRAFKLWRIFCGHIFVSRKILSEVNRAIAARYIDKWILLTYHRINSPIKAKYSRSIVFFNFKASKSSLTKWHEYAVHRRQQKRLVLFKMGLKKLRQLRQVTQLSSYFNGFCLQRATLRYTITKCSLVMRKLMDYKNRRIVLKRNFNVFRSMHPIPKCSPAYSILLHWRYEYLTLMKLWKKFEVLKTLCIHKKLLSKCWITWYRAYEMKVLIRVKKRKYLLKWNKKVLALKRYKKVIFARSRLTDHSSSNPCSEFLQFILRNFIYRYHTNIAERSNLKGLCKVRRLFREWLRTFRRLNSFRRKFRKNYQKNVAIIVYSVQCLRIISAKHDLLLSRKIFSIMKQKRLRRLNSVNKVLIKFTGRKYLLVWIKQYNFRVMRVSLSAGLKKMSVVTKKKVLKGHVRQPIYVERPVKADKENDKKKLALLKVNESQAANSLLNKSKSLIGDLSYTDMYDRAKTSDINNPHVASGRNESVNLTSATSSSNLNLTSSVNESYELKLNEVLDEFSRMERSYLARHQKRDGLNSKT